MALLVGNDSIGAFTTASSLNGVAGGNFLGMQYVASASGNATSLWFYANDRAESENIKILLADASGNVIGTTGVISYNAGTGAAWKTAAITSTPITSGLTYYIGVYVSSADGRVGNMSSGLGNYNDATSGTYASPPATLSALAANGGNTDMALYADGSAGGGGLSVISHYSRPNVLLRM